MDPLHETGWDRRLREGHERAVRRARRGRLAMSILTVALVVLCVVLWTQRHAASQVTGAIQQWIDRMAHPD